MLLYILLSVAATALATWAITKSIFAKTTVALATHQYLQKELADVRTEHGIRKGFYEAAVMNREVADARAEELQARLSEKGEQLSTALANCTSATKNLSDTVASRDLAIADVIRQTDALYEAKAEIARLTAENKACLQKLEEQKAFVAEMKNSMEREFKIIASATLDSNSERIGKEQKEKLTATLQPFADQIKDFRQQVEDKFRIEGNEKSSLQKEVELLAKASQMLNKQATDLTEALRGSTKQQGDWGEGLLERILEHCGLKEGIDYTVQSSEKATDGSNYRPDVVLHMVGGRNLVVDSKVSLNAYWDMCGCEDADARGGYLPQICKALKAHIDELHRRPYNEVKGTPGYLIMFIPVEAAYITALQHDGSLWKYAYDKNVLLISPTNLIPFVRMVESLWDREKKYKNSMDIANKAAALYDKLAGFVANYEKVGNALRTAQKSYDDSYGQLATGRGNLIAKAEEMKALSGGKGKLPQAMVDAAVIADGIVLPELIAAAEEEE